MSVHRVMGIETEYGISVPGHPHVNAMSTSSAVVTSYSGVAVGDRRNRARWDFDEEHPLRDARGYDMSRAEADPSQLTDEDLGLANLILTNGARLYVDHAHPEFSSPEVTNPRDAVLWDRAGMEIMADAAEAATAAGPFTIQLYKNNTDNKGASYGCHENYLMRRSTPFADIVRDLTPFFVTRQVYSGAGRVGRGQEGREPGFQLSQRADFFEVEVGLETTLKRPIINTRDEPHADPERHRRLHVIVGDANLAEAATYLKMGSTALVLSLIEAGALSDSFVLADPVREIHAVSHDPTLQHRLTLRDGRRLTALEIQRSYLEAAADLAAQQAIAGIDSQTADVLARWDRVLVDLAEDPRLAADRVDWAAKLALLEGYRRRDGLAWDSARLELVDLQYADIRPARGLALRLEASGRLERLTTPAEVAHAREYPPNDTRAYFRGECLRRYGDAVAAASWDSIIFDIPGHDALQRVPTLEPVRGTRDHVGGLLDASSTAEELLEALRGA
ncbi:MAG: proteasome accessory factor PafA2 [Actinobacteria bacterium]|nr:proteasome accessory factor PafA2 [Actinomycetota bacterium]